ncbi:O-antigen ligase family protein [Heliorestis acidaminivorans]|uniref:O-antigen ligase family protein n=1 Tax=Heliorestis acidaminivorans TaxID=553427 RepID=UPI001478ACFF|nr:O-antigen ligase family protein [Heliorestis acidaminivorans]
MKNKKIDVFLIIFFIVLFLYPLLIIPNSTGLYTAPRFIMLVFIALVALYLLVQENIKFHFSMTFLGFFLTTTFLSSLLAQDKLTAFIGTWGPYFINFSDKKDSEQVFYLTRFTGLITYFSCAVLFLLATKAKSIEKIFMYLISGATVVSLLAVLQYYGIDLVPQHENYKGFIRSHGTFGNPNFLGTYTVFILPAALLFFLKFKKYYWLLSSSIIYAGMLVSTTRGAWIAFLYLIVLIFYIKYKSIEKRKALIQLGVALVLTTFILSVSKEGYIYNRFISVPEQIVSAAQLDDKAGSSRMYIWKEVVKIIPDNWAFGVGPDHLIYEGILMPNPNKNIIVDKAHNIYLEIAATMGLFSLAAYLAFLSFFLRPWKNDLGFLYFTMISTYLLQGFFNIDVIMVMPLFWIILGLSLRNQMKPEEALWFESEKLIIGNCSPDQTK